LRATSRIVHENNIFFLPRMTRHKASQLRKTYAVFRGEFSRDILAALQLLLLLLLLLL
jgi:hypothetical protein